MPAAVRYAISKLKFYEGCLLEHQLLLVYMGDGDDIPPALTQKLLDIVVRQIGMKDEKQYDNK